MSNIENQPDTDRTNSLLTSLSADDLARLRPHLRSFDIAGGQWLSSMSTGEAMSCFPTTLVTSMVQTFDDGTRFDVGLIGAEGMFGWSALLGAGSAVQSGVVQMLGGTCLALPTARLIALCAESPPLHAALLRFIHSFSVQMSYTIVANLSGAVERRLARWLLMLHDRVDGDALVITHGDLAAALHVRRASITDALHLIEGERLVRCTRGRIVMRDRNALRRLAGGAYGPAEAAYRALIGDFGKR